jgi:hypothetical protein
LSKKRNCFVEYHDEELLEADDDNLEATEAVNFPEEDDGEATEEDFHPLVIYCYAPAESKWKRPKMSGLKNESPATWASREKRWSDEERRGKEGSGGQGETKNGRVRNKWSESGFKTRETEKSYT